MNDAVADERDKKIALIMGESHASAAEASQALDKSGGSVDLALTQLYGDAKEHDLQNSGRESKLNPPSPPVDTEDAEGKVAACEEVADEVTAGEAFNTEARSEVHHSASPPTREDTSGTLNDIEAGVMLASSREPPQAPRQPTQPGAVAVAGPHADEYDGDGFTISPTVESRQPEENTPISADLVDVAEEERKRQEELKQERSKWEKEAPVAEPVPDRKCGRRTWAVSLVVLLLVVVAVVLGTVLTRTNETGPNASGADDIPVYANLTEQQEFLYSQISRQLEIIGLPTDDFLLKDGYQYKAFEWLSRNENLESYYLDDQVHIKQRYALAALFYSTNDTAHDFSENPGPWINDHLWLSDEDECSWEHVQCDRDRVQGLDLERNNLSGKIPLDLALLRESLLTVKLTSNAIRMMSSDLFVFGYLNKLRHLDFSDNFLEISGGLPRNMTALQSLETLKASYNLMSGPLDNGVLESLTKLTHLEIEGNFFTGALTFLGEMPGLVTVYLRRNDLSGPLQFIENPLPNLFSIWLDSNEITGTIPRNVGNLTSLTNLSIVNASLVGSIPTEIGLLPLLERLWLSGNPLSGSLPQQLANLTKLEVLEIQRTRITGTMPAEVCERIRDSDYENKSLVADCDFIECADCCTRCW